MSSQLVPAVLTRRIITCPQLWHRATSPGARAYTRSPATGPVRPQWAHRLIAAVRSTAKISARGPARALPSTWVSSTPGGASFCDVISASSAAEALGSHALGSMPEQHQIGGRLLDEARGAAHVDERLEVRRPAVARQVLRSDAARGARGPRWGLACVDARHVQSEPALLHLGAVELLLG